MRFPPRVNSSPAIAVALLLALLWQTCGLVLCINSDGRQIIEVAHAQDACCVTGDAAAAPAIATASDAAPTWRHAATGCADVPLVSPSRWRGDHDREVPPALLLLPCCLTFDLRGTDPNVKPRWRCQADELDHHARMPGLRAAILLL